MRNLVQAARLSPQARAFAAAALSAHTRRTYAAQWATWLAHCQSKSLRALPARPEDVANWLAVRATSGAPGGRRALAARAGQSLSTLRLAVAALRLARKAKGLGFDSRHPAIALVLRGIARTHAEVQAQASRCGHPC